MYNGDPRTILEAVLRDATSIEHALTLVMQQESLDDRENFETFAKYADQCESVLELGSGFSTIAFVKSCNRVVTVDMESLPFMGRLLELSLGRLAFTQGSGIELAPEPFDMLFIDTVHTYSHLTAELNRHASSIAKYILLHDTESHGWSDSRFTVAYNPGDRGVMPAVLHFISRNPEWSIVKHVANINGLTVLAVGQFQ